MLILFLAIVGLSVAVIAVAYFCYRIAFYVPRAKRQDPDRIDLPEGPAYEPYHDAMRRWTLASRQLPCESVSITTFDGLTLTGKYYEFAPDAPIELMFHGYRGSAERDLSGGIHRCFCLGRSALVVDQRCSGGSGGKTITFGAKEHLDCLCWVEFMLRRFGPEVKILLTGISMGASTVLMAGGEPLPKNVIGILADCGFTSARDIICSVIRKMGLPPRLCYPFVRLGAILFGGFDPNEADAARAVERCTVPVIFYHGEADDYVPCEMSLRNYNACTCRKQLVTVPGAGHGLSYPAAPELYIQSLWEFFGPEASAAGFTPKEY